MLAAMPWPCCCTPQGAHLPDLPLGAQLRGIGSNATILQGDIVSCGPSVIHVIDAVSTLCRAFSTSLCLCFFA